MTRKCHGCSAAVGGRGDVLIDPPKETCVEDVLRRLPADPSLLIDD